MTLHPLTSKEGAFVLKLGLVFKNIRVPMVHGYFYSEETRKGRFCLNIKFYFRSPNKILPNRQLPFRSSDSVSFVQP